MTDGSKHTPGPWYVDGSGIRALVRGADLTIVAVRHRLPGDIHEVNARLIAAAPDLLAALRDCRNAMYADNPADGWLEIIQAADAALAKATQQEGR